MICEKCKKKEATVFYEESINGKSRSYSLCSDCASELQKNGEIGLGASLEHDFWGTSPFGGDFFGGLFRLPEHAAVKKTCPLCHASFESFRKSGKAGCPVCYETFLSELMPTLRSIHGSVKHIGRTPKKTEDADKPENELDALKAELRDAIAKEDFEKAATLRDSIRAMENNR